MSSLPIFKGKHDIFSSYQEKLFSIAKTTHLADSHGQGMLAALLSAEQFSALPFQATLLAPVLYEPWTPAGDQPNPVNEHFSEYFQIWKYHATSYETQQESISKFRSIFINSLSEEVQIDIGMATHGLDSLSLPAIYRELITLYDTLSTSQVTEMMFQLNTPMVEGSSFAVLKVAHVKIHNIFAKAGPRFIMRDYDKVTALKNATQHIEIFRNKTQLWIDITPAEIDQTFPSLAASLQAVDDNKPRSSNNTVTTATYTGIPHSVSSSPPDFHEAIAAAVKSALAAERSKRSAKDGPYCYTHNRSGHKTSECRNPKHPDGTADTARNPEHVGQHQRGYKGKKTT